MSWGSLGVWGETAESPEVLASCLVKNLFSNHLCKFCQSFDPEVGCGARSKDGQLLASGDGVSLNNFENILSSSVCEF